MFSRDTCVFCSGKLEYIFNRDNYPITASPPLSSSPYENDKYSNQVFYTCEKCSCVQLGTLVDPSLLYQNSHNDTYSTPTWIDHLKEFSKFVMKLNSKDLLEIGGNGKLADLMNGSIDYSCLDICEPLEKLANVQYFKGNCEEYEYKNTYNIVMSHVFEHLFNPRKFVEKMNQCEIESVFLSIPNMKRALELCVPNILHNEHTFYVDEHNIRWLFSQFNYELRDSYEFRNHSLFLHFRRNTAIAKLDLIERPEISSALFSQMKSTNFQDLHIKPNSFIVPAGLFGQILYYYTKPTILGFLDNDASKQGCRVYGTPHSVFNFDVLKTYENCTIYLLAGNYNKEIREKIESYNKNFKLVEL
jgi:hypothetical protein